MVKTILFIPGFQEDLTTRDYAAVLTAIKGAGFKVQFVPITWKGRSISGWVTEFMQVYAKYDPSTTILAGFSFGAVIALIAASKRVPSELWLCSLSPYFAEDIPDVPVEWSEELGVRIIKGFEKVTFASLAPRVTCKTLLLVGESEGQEWPILLRRSNEAHRLLADSLLTVIPGVHHDVANLRYIQALVTQISI